MAREQQGRLAFSLGPSVFYFAQQRQTPRPSVDGVRSKALRPFGLQSIISRIQQYSADGCISLLAISPGKYMAQAHKLPIMAQDERTQLSGILLG